MVSIAINTGVLQTRDSSSSAKGRAARSSFLLGARWRGGRGKRRGRCGNRRGRHDGGGEPDGFGFFLTHAKGGMANRIAKED